MTRILIADQHAVVREGLRLHLEATQGWKVVAEAGDGREAILKAVETMPDVAVLAFALPFLNGVELIRQIRARLPKTEVVIFTQHSIENQMSFLLRAGARGCVHKSEPIRHLIDAVKSAASRKHHLTPAIRIKRNGSGSPLSTREREVVKLVAEGHKSKAVAKLLGISVKTVEAHRLNIGRKLDCTRSADLVRYAVRNQIAAA
jgi:DNA-binding NarL/FixJ family response regulator